MKNPSFFTAREILHIREHGFVPTFETDSAMHAEDLIKGAPADVVEKRDLIAEALGGAGARKRARKQARRVVEKSSAER